MSSELYYDFEKLAKSAKIFFEELQRLNQLDKRYLTNAIDDLDKMHSGSTKNLADSLKKMGNADLTILATKLDQYSKSSAFTGAEMERVDTELAEIYQQGIQQNG